MKTRKEKRETAAQTEIYFTSHNVTLTCIVTTLSEYVYRFLKAYGAVHNVHSWYHVSIAYMNWWRCVDDVHKVHLWYKV